MAEKKEFTLEDILEEQRNLRDQDMPPEGAPEEQIVPAEPVEEPIDAPAEEPSEEMENISSGGVSSDTADLNAFATGNIQIVPEMRNAGREPAREKASEEPAGKKKKKKRGLFGRKKKMPDFDETEDMYYGLQLKPIDEYRKGFDPATGEFTLGQDGYKALFDDSKKAIDDEVEENFQRLQKERRRRVAEAVQNAGVDESEIADEFGVVAPMPVTAFAADPYAKQHGIEVEGSDLSQEEIPDIQKAMMETSVDQTMEIKLNVLNDTIELQRVKDMPAVSEESINKILESIESEAKQEKQASPEGQAVPEEIFQEEPVSEEQVPQQEQAASQGHLPAEEKTVEFSMQQAEQGAEQPGAARQDAPAGENVITGRPLGEIPQIASIYEYRSRSIPTHVINVDVLQSALLSESESLIQAAEEEELRHAPRRRVRNKKLEERQEEEQEQQYRDSGESIDDYTGPEDAKSISHELRSDMRELTMRMTITGVCTVLLALVNLIFGGAAGEASSMTIVYVVLTVVFLLVAIGVCYRTVMNGLKALFGFHANSDSAAAVAAVTVFIQTVASIFFRSELAEGKLHLYAVVLSAILFVNAAGKLTMIRRIHSNFRFITSKEQKYAVRAYDDYNTSLKMTKDSVAEKPLIAYQCKAGFLKRFLELSYNPDPSESASQLLAPIGLVSSLVVCIACLLITRNVPTALSTLAAASCACVAVSNMLSVNLPISRLCKTARRAGAMVVGYEAVEQLGNVNAVLVDAEEIFPRGTVVLGGIKTFGNRAGAETAIMAASALMKEIGGPLSGVFDQVISENEDALPEVEDFTYEENGGIIGQVDGQKIYIGDRTLMIRHQIEVPPREEETQYLSGNKVIVYIAVEETISAMLVLTYAADRRRKTELQRLEESGISILIRTTDPNVTSQMVSKLFGVDANSVSILDGEIGDTAQKLLGERIRRADAVVATKGRVESMMSVISACVEEKRTAGLVVAIQNIAVVLGFVLVAFMACFGAIRQLSAFVLFAFELFWLLVIMVLPKLRK
ncbi:MAG: hypothetical protein J1E06_06245 [Acutalibacter sp.]|nr:hypothetical protein [Acutalibacter sp.]